MRALVWMGLGKIAINLRIFYVPNTRYRYIKPLNVPVYKCQIK
jgi:hypothetical protein